MKTTEVSLWYTDNLAYDEEGTLSRWAIPPMEGELRVMLLDDGRVEYLGREADP